MPEVTVAICTRNRSGLLAKVLEDLRGQTGLDCREWEILIVDNDSTDATWSTAAAFAETSPIVTRVVREPQQGIPFARNRAVTESQSTYIAFIDDDMVPPCPWLVTLLSTMREKKADGVGGRVLPYWEAARPPWLPDSMLHNVGVLDMGEEARWFLTDHTDGIFGTGNVLFRKDVFDRWGCFRTDLPHCEDHEMFLRLRKKRAKLFYAPAAVAFHRIPPERLTKRYITRWNFANARMFARFHDPKGACFFRHIPNWSIRCLLEEGWAWLRLGLRGRNEEGFQHFTRCVFWVGYVLGRSSYAPPTRDGAPEEDDVLPAARHKAARSHRRTRV